MAFVFNCNSLGFLIFPCPLLEHEERLEVKNCVSVRDHRFRVGVNIFHVGISVLHGKRSVGGYW